MQRKRGVGCAVAIAFTASQTNLMIVRAYNLNRIRAQLPGESVERFECSRRVLCGLLGAFRIIDVDSLLQAIELMSVGA